MPLPEPSEVVIRIARDDDFAGIIALIAAVYAEYDGCILDVDGEEPELRAVATAFGRAGGGFWVAERDGRVVGTVGFMPAVDGGLELKKLYLARELRGSGVAERLCDHVEAEARRRGARHVALWSDTRFTRAHRFYERRGYVREPRTRELHDRSRSVEYAFRLAL